jgi:hypothetical protein
MADADGTYPLDALPGFVARLEQGDDLVIGSRFDGEIHRGAMPWANRYVGNPILTGLLNVLFGVKVSDAHCGMRAIRRDALRVLDLHSTGMELASEMVFKAFRRGLTVSEIPIEYFPRTGESKLRRSRDAWRHVRFMLLYSPSWLYLVPGGLLLMLGLAGMLALATGPIDVLGRSWEIHTMFGFVALTLRSPDYPDRRLRTNVRPCPDRRMIPQPIGAGRLGRARPWLRCDVLAAVAGLLAISIEWAEGFGRLGRV